MNIVFVYPDFVVIRKKPGKEKFHTVRGGWYSEGLASLSAVAKERGNRTSLIHLKEPAEKRELQEKLKALDPSMIIFTVRSSGFFYVKKYVGWAKEACPSAKIILGGCHATIAPKECIGIHGVDFVCVGEGEGALIDICETIESGREASAIPNLVFKKKNGEMVQNPPRKLISSLDSLPLPDFELFDYSSLIASQIKVATVMISRGCPFSCAYCCNHRIREVYPDPQNYTRFRSPHNAIEYLKKLLSLYPWIESVRFLDNILGIEKGWIAEFAELYREEISLPFACDQRPNLATREVLETLKKAGCYQIYFGVETGNEELRKKVLARNISDQQIIEAFKFCRDLKIKSLAYNIVGLPSEKPEDALSTVKLNSRIRPDYVVTNIFTPYPYTRLYDLCLEKGFISEKDLNPETGLIDYRDEVFLDQPQFPKKQVLFFALYLNFFSKIYYCTRGSGFLWNIFDRILLWKNAPLSVFIFLKKVQEKATDGIKSFLRKRASFAYIFFRNLAKRTKSI